MAEQKYINGEPVFDVTFREPDSYGEASFHWDVPLTWNDNGQKQFVYVNLAINGHEPIRFQFEYHDAGTVGYARMDGKRAMGGRLTNVTKEWGKDNDDISFIYAIGSGTVSRNSDAIQASLHIWVTDAKKSLKNLAFKKHTCLNCGHEFIPKVIHTDELGQHVTCPKCESSSNVQ